MVSYRFFVFLPLAGCGWAATGVAGAASTGRVRLECSEHSRRAFCIAIAVVITAVSINIAPTGTNRIPKLGSPP